MDVRVGWVAGFMCSMSCTMLNFSNSNEDKKTKGKANNITESNVGTCVCVL